MTKIEKITKSFLNKAKCFLLDLADKKNCLISFLLVFLSSVALLFAGATNDSTNGYKCAAYFANIVKNKKIPTKAGIF